MQRFGRTSVSTLFMTLVLVACSAPAPSNSSTSAEAVPIPNAQPKRLQLAIVGDPVAVFPGIDQRQASSSSELEGLVNAGLTNSDVDGVPHAQLAEQVPTVENGLWTVLPDGRMETSWRIRDGAVWHDGTPFTSADLLFTLQVNRDKELPYFSNVIWGYVDEAQAVDPHTIIVRWNTTYIHADSLFSVAATGGTTWGTPMPRHLLETAYTSNKAGFIEQPYWSTAHVGAGAYRLTTFDRGSQVVLDAFDQYVLGRPKIDRIVVKFIQDQETMAANLLAGAVDATMGRGLSVEQAVNIRKSWPAGAIAEPVYQSWVRILPQFINPTPVVILQLSFRQALLYAVDRQQIVDTIQEGVGAVAEMTPSVSSPYYATLAPSMVRYAYDPRKAAELLGQLGYTKGPDGMLQDAAGTKLAVEIRTTQDNAARLRSMQVVADDWQRLGVGVEQSITSVQLQGDRAYRQERPGFEINRNGATLDSIAAYTTPGILRAENNYRGVGPLNYPRYGNPELDALTDRYNHTIDLAERLRVAGQIINHITSNLVVMGLYYDAEPVMVSKRLRNFNGQVWAAHEWDLVD